jgi:hypothetical protein
MTSNYRAWLDKKIAQQKQEIAALLRKPDTDANGRQLNLLQDELLDYRMALGRFMEFERETRWTVAPLTATPAMLDAYGKVLAIGSELDGSMVWSAMLDASGNTA